MDASAECSSKIYTAFKLNYAASRTTKKEQKGIRGRQDSTIHDTDTDTDKETLKTNQFRNHSPKAFSQLNDRPQSCNLVIYVDSRLEARSRSNSLSTLLLV